MSKLTKPEQTNALNTRGRINSHAGCETSGPKGKTAHLSSSTDVATPCFPYYVVALSMAIPALLLGLLLGGSSFTVSAVKQGRVDFRQLYAAGYMVRTGHSQELYDYSKQKVFQDTVVTPARYFLPFIRPAYQGLLFVPLSLLSFRYAYAAWMALNILFLYLSLRLLQPWMAKIRTIWKWLPFGLLAGYIPIGIALMQGQDSIELLLIASGTLVLTDARRTFSAGGLFALGLFKFQIVLPVALLFLLWKRWRFCAGFISTGILLAAISFWLTGLEPIRAYIRSLLSIGLVPQSASALILPVPINLMPNLHGLTFGIAAGHLSQISIGGLTVFLSVALFLWVWRQAHSGRSTTSNSEEFVMALTTSALVSYYFFLHDATILFLPFVVILAALVSPNVTKPLSALPLIACLLLFVSPVWFFVSSGNFYWVSLCLIAFLVASVNAIANQPAAQI